MSHISKIELEVNDIQALKAACQHLGLDFKDNQQTFTWYYGQGHCAHAIKVPMARYEIGVVGKDKGYELQADFWDQDLTRAVGQEGGLLKQRYAVERTRREARRKGYRIIEKTTQTGIRLHVRL
ncbi:MAG: DUF1257 domain-containing protein [Desulfovermiculus sp.]|nr:DUF1257 domain-containing protein [Desulfovermiculus sp.]